MEPRWQSRQTPAWRSINSLERHQFVKRVSNQWQRAQNDFQRGQMSHDEFSLTDKGVRFLNVMLKKFGEGDDYAGGAGGERSAPSWCCAQRLRELGAAAVRRPCAMRGDEPRKNKNTHTQRIRADKHTHTQTHGANAHL